MIKYFLSILIVLFFTATIFSQDFDSAAGLRLGYPTSLSYKKFINESSALEGYVGYRGYYRTRFISFSGAYLIHKDIEEVDNLQYYFGGGASVYLWSSDFDIRNTTSLGLQGYLGLSYTFEELPLNLSIDWVPTVFINGLVGYGSGFGAGYGSLAIRYVLSKGGESRYSNTKISN